MATDYLGKALQRASLPAIDAAGNRAWVDFEHGLAKTEECVHQGHGRTGAVRQTGPHGFSQDFSGSTLGGKDDGAPYPYKRKEMFPRGFDGPMRRSFQRADIERAGGPLGKGYDGSKRARAEKADRDARLAKFSGGYGAQSVGGGSWDESKHPRGQHGLFSSAGGQVAAGVAGAAALGAAGYAAHRFGLGGVAGRYARSGLSAARRAGSAVGTAASDAVMHGQMNAGLAAGAVRPRVAEAAGAAAGAARNAGRAGLDAARDSYRAGRDAVGSAVGRAGDATMRGQMTAGLAAGAVRNRAGQAAGAVAGAAGRGFDAARTAATTAGGQVRDTASRAAGFAQRSAGRAGDAVNQGRMAAGLASGAARNRIGQIPPAIAGSARQGWQGIQAAGAHVTDAIRNASRSVRDTTFRGARAAQTGARNAYAGAHMRMAAARGGPRAAGAF